MKHSISTGQIQIKVLTTWSFFLDFWFPKVQPQNLQGPIKRDIDLIVIINFSTKIETAVQKLLRFGIKMKCHFSQH